MTWKKRLRLIIDIAMIVFMPILMAYELAGAALHEYLGIAVFILFVVHHALNFRWIRGIAKGRWSAVRFLSLTVNLLLLVIMFLLPISGIIMSKHIFVFLNFGTGIALARTLHLLASYWGFLLMSLHIGFHGGIMQNAATAKNVTPGIRKILFPATAALVSVYGIYVFFRRGIAGYLFLTKRFVFFDFSAPLVFFLIDYFAVMTMAACAGYCLMRALMALPGRNSGSHTVK